MRYKNYNPQGMHRVTINDGSSRSYSVFTPNPKPFTGKHAKTSVQVRKRHLRNVLRNVLRNALTNQSEES